MRTSGAARSSAPLGTRLRNFWANIPRNLPDFEAHLENFVKAAGPEHDERLLRYFAAQVERRVAIFGPTQIGRSAQRVHLPPIE